MPFTNRTGLGSLGLPSKREAELLDEIDALRGDLHAFVAVAMQNGLQDYCLDRHPDIVQSLRDGMARSEEGAGIKYAKILKAIERVPGLRASQGDTGERTYYQNATDNVAYLEHELRNKRFILSGIWVAPEYRGSGIASRILGRLVEAADELDFGITLYHDPFGEEGLSRHELEAFYNRYGFQRHETVPGGMFRFPGTPLDRH